MESRDRLLPVLHEIQDRSSDNSISPAELELLSKRFGLTKAELRGVASYYSLLSLIPRGRHVIRLCASPVCRMLGSHDLLDRVKRELEIEIGGTTPDGLITLEESQCLGHCASAPAMMIDDRIYEDLDRERVMMILGDLRSGTVKDGIRD